MAGLQGGSPPSLFGKWLYNYFTMVTVCVPTVAQRKRIPQEAIDQVVQQIVEKFKPQKIILFGSYARGNPRPESDVDLLVVMDTPIKEVQQAIRICQQIEYRFGLDLIVHTPKYLAERVKMGDWFLRDVLKEGKVLYEARNR
jgi:predicted nucleotidyltransferase